MVDNFKDSIPQQQEKTMKNEQLQNRILIIRLLFKGFS